MNWIYVVLIVCAIASVCALGIAIWVVFIDNKNRQKPKNEKQEMESELQAAKDEFYAERQRLEKTDASRPTPLPLWVEREVIGIQRRIRNSLDIAKGAFAGAAYEAGDDDFSAARASLENFRRELDSARKDIYRLAGIQKWAMRFRRNAERKAEAALVLVDQVQELGKAMSDQGIVLGVSAFDILQSVADELEAMIDANGEGADDRSDEILGIAEELLAHAEVCKYTLVHLAALRAYVPKLIADNQHRPSDLMIRNGDAIRVLERIKSSSADHLWFDLDRQLKEVPGRIRQSRVSLALATEMSSDGSQAYLAAKQESEAAVAILDEAELLFDEISELDARLTAAQEKVIKTFGEVKIVVGSAVHAVEGREEVSVAAKQLALRACVAIERASYLVSVSEAFDHLGAVEALGHARQFAEAAIDRAQLDTKTAGTGIDLTIWSRDHADAEEEPVTEAVESMPPAGFTGEYVASPHGGAGGGTSQ